MMFTIKEHTNKKLFLLQSSRHHCMEFLLPFYPNLIYYLSKKFDFFHKTTTRFSFPRPILLIVSIFISRRTQLYTVEGSSILMALAGVSSEYGSGCSPLEDFVSLPDSKRKLMASSTPDGPMLVLIDYEKPTLTRQKRNPENRPDFSAHMQPNTCR